MCVCVCVSEAMYLEFNKKINRLIKESSGVRNASYQMELLIKCSQLALADKQLEGNEAKSSISRRGEKEI